MSEIEYTATGISHSSLPHPLPPPPATVTAGPQGDDLADEVQEAYWSVHDGAAAKASVRQVLVGLPRITALVGRLAWRADRRSTFCIVVCQILAAAMNAFTFIVGVAVLQQLFTQGPSPEAVRSALPQLIYVVGLFTARAVLETFVSIAQARIMPKIRTALESDFLYLTANVRLEAVEDADWHDEVHRANSRGLNYAQQIVGQVVSLVSAALALVGTSGVLSALHPALLPLLLLSALPVGASAVYNARSRFTSVKRWNALQRRVRVFSWLLLDVDAAAELRSNTVQGALLEEHGRLTHDIANEDIRLGVREALVNLTGRALGGLGTGIIYAALACMLIAGWLPLSAGAGAVLAIQSGQVSLTRLVGVAHVVYEHALWVSDLLSIQERSRRRLPIQAGQKAPSKVHSIVMEDVSFTYPGKEISALEGISISLLAGQRVAFVGLNGSGKSTCAKLLAGLYEPQRGSVRWDGVNVRDMESSSLYRQVACVFQEPMRFPFSALSNVVAATGTLTQVDQERALAAVHASKADDVIASLPYKWETLLSKRFKGGQQLSGGQWAKLAVARGLYKNAPLLLLDEPTASMDPPSEHDVYEAVLRGRLREDQITVLISHRLASVVDCDTIYVFDGGRIVESGSHEVLIALGGAYAKMFALQAEGYRSVYVGQSGSPASS
ncbi:ABC transporter ATP-binding protein [Streptomyces sp. NPDC088354]|uniref:ABC transporter ATP-binding protein n=1 Tax=Streptomyces sp. NPDC088354 TaxID=3365856 RepID=UPI003816FC9A